MTDTTGWTYEKLAKFQNMSISKTKAIEIMELLVPKWSGVKWANMEDQITNIIEAK